MLFRGILFDAFFGTYFFLRMADTEFQGFLLSFELFYWFTAQPLGTLFSGNLKNQIDGKFKRD